MAAVWRMRTTTMEAYLLCNTRWQVGLFMVYHERALDNYVISCHTKYSGQHNQCDIRARHVIGRLDAIPSNNYVAALLYSDWLYFYSLVTDGHFVCACARWDEYFVFGAKFGAICYFWTRCGGFLNGRSTLYERSCQERWKITTTLHTFLTLWIFMVFAGTLVRTYESSKCGQNEIKAQRSGVWNLI